MLACLTDATPLDVRVASLTCPACHVRVPLLHGTTYDFLTAYGLETPALREERARWNQRGAVQVSGDALYDAGLSWLGRWEVTAHRRLVRPYVAAIPLQGATVLEIGGLGTRGLRLMEEGIARYVHLEVSDGSQVASRQIFQQHGIDAPSARVTYVRAPAEHLPFHDETFDLVVSHGTLHHTDRRRSYPEVRRVLRSGGAFVCTDNYAAPLVKLALAVYRRPEAGSDNPLDERDLRLLGQLFTIRCLHATGGLEWLDVYWHRIRRQAVRQTGLTRRLRSPAFDHAFSRWVFRGGVAIVAERP